MPSDSNLNPDDPNSDLGTEEEKLPDELASLGEQLQADAAYLAAQYPANATATGDSRPAVRREQPPPTISRQRILAISTLAVALVFFLVLPAGLNRLGVWNGNKSDHTSDQHDIAVNDPGIESEITKSDNPNSVVTVDDAIGEAELTPVYLLPEVSGPEMEGLLDLIQDENQQQATLSL